jgi:ribosomal protein L7Ae-like RNA K-turn-binding protein
MDNHQKLLSFLGIARKAGALQIGGFLSFAAVKDKKAKMLICAQDAAESTKKECEHSKEIKKLTVLYLFTKEQLGAAFGKEEISVVAVTKKDFSDNIKRMIGMNINGGDAT